MPEQLIGSRFPGQPCPVGSVVTFFDRHRRTVFPAVTELRPHEAIVGGDDDGRWRVRYTGLQLIKAGPTGGATMQQDEDHAAELLERHLNPAAPATWWRFRFATATGQAGVCRHDTRTIALSVSFVLQAACDDIRDTLLHEVAHAIVGAGHGHDAVWRTAARRIGCTANHCTTFTHSLKRSVRECPPVPKPVVPPTPDGDTAPTLHLPTLPLAHRLENQHPRGRPPTAGNPTGPLGDQATAAQRDRRGRGALCGQGDACRPRAWPSYNYWAVVARADPARCKASGYGLGAARDSIGQAGICGR